MLKNLQNWPFFDPSGLKTKIIAIYGMGPKTEIFRISNSNVLIWGQGKKYQGFSLPFEAEKAPPQNFWASEQ